MYLDGSLLDGPTRLLGRNGWGFCAANPDGMIIAEAQGLPPAWADGIHGGELWALHAALICSMQGVAFRSDRAAVVDTFKAGLAAATDAAVVLARLWAMVFAACDYGDALQLDLAWMPAHTSEADVGRLVLSDGSLLTALDRRCNDRADTLAKEAARSHRLPVALRQEVKVRGELAEWAARSLAIATHVANNARVPGSAGPRRDSVGRPKAKHRVRAKRRVPATTATAPAPPAEAAAQVSDDSESSAPVATRTRRRRRAARRRPEAVTVCHTDSAPAKRCEQEEVDRRVALLSTAASDATPRVVPCSMPATPDVAMPWHVAAAAPVRVAPRVGRPAVRAVRGQGPSRQQVDDAIGRLTRGSK